MKLCIDCLYYMLPYTDTNDIHEMVDLVGFLAYTRTQVF